MRRARMASAAALLAGVLAPVVHASADPWKDAARYALEYRVDLPSVEIATGQKVRMWLPLPVETPDQTIVSEEMESPWPIRVVEDVNGNRIAYIEGTGPGPAPVVLLNVIDRRPSTGLRKDRVTAGSGDDPERYRKAARLIPLDGLIRQIAEQESTGLLKDDEKVRAFYDYVVANMSYDKSGTGWGQGNAIWACTNKRGNCTEFHSLFIGMARSQEIPARFVIGLPVPGEQEGEIPGYHCWAEFWDESIGWIPLDSSEAKKRDQVDEYFGRLPNDRVEFTTGRDLVLEPAQAGEPLNYFIYPYIEVDGEPIEQVPAKFWFERRGMGAKSTGTES